MFSIICRNLDGFKGAGGACCLTSGLHRTGARVARFRSITRELALAHPMGDKMQFPQGYQQGKRSNSPPDQTTYAVVVCVLRVSLEAEDGAVVGAMPARERPRRQAA